MADGKWISDLEATTPLADAARHVLAVRLDTVGHFLPLAVRESDKDPEHVHQLRVATRRAGAALVIFASCLPEEVFRSARKQLRRVRRAAGAARDWDVFQDTLTAWAKGRSGRQRPAVDFLTGFALARRTAAQADLEGASADLFQFERVAAATVAAVQRPRSEPELRTLLDLARPLLGRLLHDLHEAARGDLNDYDHLHEVRILGKRLRYAMEVFACCFEPAFRDQIYPEVEEMQDVLGLANDSHVAGQRLEDIRSGVQALRPQDWKRLRPGIEGFLRFHQDRLHDQRKRFDDWWRRWQKAGGEGRILALVKTQPEGNGAPPARRRSPGKTATTR